MASFSDILSQQSDDLPTSAPLIPAGTYEAVVSGPHQVRELTTKNGDTEILEIPLKLQVALDDVDTSDFNPIGRVVSITFWAGADEWKLNKFLKNDCGLSGTMGQMLGDSLNSRVGVTVTHKMEKGEMRARATRTMAL